MALISAQAVGNGMGSIFTQSMTAGGTEIVGKLLQEHCCHCLRVNQRTGTPPVPQNVVQYQGQPGQPVYVPRDCSGKPLLECKSQNLI